MPILFKQYANSATRKTLADILGIDPGSGLKSFDIIGQTGNVGSIYIGGAAVTNAPANAGGLATATQGYSQGPFMTNIIPAADVNVVGTANDIVFITAEI